ncbi:DUF4232 domain-containing protein [Amycolatopsis rubida]|uniref:DUF4232 domain-containing protein n=1 Tax=Amycolatopsis rubida TaxID=112413 RepID=A0A1I5EIE2_9PSEU|nr:MULTISPECIES: DUF4232 domain-containing protein [Amycolatopsis]MYW97162.1 DUF4232 domain-containing protein [Amycolatopsis rubida]NEC62147.1 DUF4232 domain-containing protein [Amycolatopsis rubida]OAP24595.1 hypothetical protein A4R44_04561 [Amycolatopsis sp. M39]SFO11160.1 Protein of unknown function [Amycolatopsis rubida]
MSTKLTRATVGAAVFASAFALAACGSPANSAAPAASSPAAASSAPASTAKEKQPDAPTPRCTTDDLSVSLGTAKPAGSQLELPLTFKNTSSHTCDLHGTPGVDLHGPDHPVYGPVDSLLRRETGPAHNVLAPGRTATAKITVLPSDPNPPAESPAWTAESLATIPPGQTKALKAAWPSNIAITRQDGATHPGTWVDGITADPS